MTRLAWRELLFSRRRLTLAIAGASIGVALVFAMLLANAGIAGELTAGIDVQRLTLAPTGAMAPAGVHASVADLRRIAGVCGVNRAAEARATLGVVRPDGAEVSIDGVVMRAVGANGFGGERTIFRRLARTSTTDIVLDKGVASALGVKTVGDPVEVRAGSVYRVFSFAGTYNPPVQDAGSRAYVSLPQLEGLGIGAVSLAELTICPHVSVTSWLQDHASDAGPGWQVDPRSLVETRLGQQARDTHQAYLGLAMLAGAAAALVIYMSLQHEVIKRTRNYVVLRALGTTRASVVLLILGESVCVGLLALPLGLGIGWALARAILALTARSIGVATPSLALTSGPIVATIAIALSSALAGGLGPSRRAAWVGRPKRTGAFLGAGAWIGLALLATAGAGSLLIGSQGWFRQVGMAALFVSVMGAASRSGLRAARLLTSVIGRSLGGRAWRATMALPRREQGGGLSVGLVMMAAAMVLATQGTILSRQNSILASARRELGSDVQIANPAGFSGPQLRALAGLGGVGKIAVVRSVGLGTVRRRGAPALTDVRLIDPTSYFAVTGFSLLPPASNKTVRADFLTPTAAVGVVSSDLAETVHAKVGDQLRLSCAGQNVHFRVIGIRTQFEPGYTVTLPTTLMGSVGKDSAAILVDINRAPGSGISRLTGNLQDYLRSSGAPPALVTTNSIQAAVGRRARRYVSLYLALIGVGAIVSFLGLANSIVMALRERRYEFGVLRAIGAQVGDMRRATTAEGVVLALTGVAIGVPLGLITEYLFVVGPDSRATITAPWGWIPIVVGAATISAVAISTVTARSLSQDTLTEALATRV